LVALSLQELGSEWLWDDMLSVTLCPTLTKPEWIYYHHLKFFLSLMIKRCHLHSSVVAIA